MDRTEIDEFEGQLFSDDLMSDMQEYIYKTAEDHGWWEGEPSVPEKLMLIVSEIAEALEEYRDGKPLDLVYFADPKDEKSKPEGFGVELADAVIRILDLCGYLQIDMAELIALKHNYNLTRSYRHGGKRA
jgi:NTP pyrophosphatase (non-canonical NTP hydrolase)